MNLPRSRNTDVVVNELGDEILIYDLNTHQAFNLNKTSSIVYQACGDGLTFDDLKKKHKFTDTLIHLALAELQKNDLLVDYTSNHFAGMSRREVVKRVGLASMIALPVISKLVAPVAAHAASGGSCAVGVCVPYGGNFCAGCTGQLITYELYPNSSNCIGTSTQPPFNASCLPGAPTSGATNFAGDLKRVAVSPI